MKKSMKFVSWFEMVGGVLAIAYAIFLAYVLQFTIAALVGAAVLTAIGVLSIVSGLLILKSKRSGWHLSIFTQVIQLPVFSLGGALWRLGLGVFSAVGFEMPKITSAGGNFTSLFEFNLGGSFLFLIGSKEFEDQYFAINLVALVVIYLLFINRKAFTNLTHHSSGTPDGAP